MQLLQQILQEEVHGDPSEGESENLYLSESKFNRMSHYELLDTFRRETCEYIKSDSQMM